MNFRSAVWIFLLGTVMAAFGWWLEKKGAPSNDVLLYTIAGHSLQVVGAFFMLLAPEEVIDDEKPRAEKFQKADEEGENIRDRVESES